MQILKLFAARKERKQKIQEYSQNRSIDLSDQLLFKYYLKYGQGELHLVYALLRSIVPETEYLESRQAITIHPEEKSDKELIEQAIKQDKSLIVRKLLTLEPEEAIHFPLFLNIHLTRKLITLVKFLNNGNLP